MPRSKHMPVGGGAKKVLATLASVRRVGLKNAARALRSNNTCKACGLGMGGQRGGMTNELDEFPSVCNKSVQAQTTDIQPPIPDAVFEHSLAELAELDGYELEHLGRLGTPLLKERGAERYVPVGWDEALGRAVAALAGTEPERTFFYSSGRSSNEAGFLLQLLARLYGTNNVNNCSYYCHQATGVALGNTIGTGTSTVELADLGGADMILVVGANPASNHPRFIHQLKACRERGGEVIVINPAREPGLVRFAVPKSAKSMLSGGTEIASAYLQPRIGSDIALFKGLAKAVVAAGGADRAFIERHTVDSNAYLADLEATGWDEILAATGLDRDAIEDIAARYGRARHAVFAWGMGLTHHLHGVDNIEQLSNLALLRGMIGRRHAGLLPLRGHSNVQGIGTIGVKPVLGTDVFKRMQDTLGIELPTGPGLDTMAGMQAAHRGEIDTALIMGGNLYGANPDAAWAEQALDRIGTKIFLTTTLNRGHVTGIAGGETIVLPVTARDEEWEPTTQESMFNFVRLSDGGIERLDNVRPEVVILADIAAGLLPDSPVDFARFRKHRHIREAIAAIVPGMEQLADIDVARREFHISGRLLHKPVFKTPDGKARFRTCEIPDTAAESFPFTLATVRSEGQFNTIVYEQHDSYRGTDSRWVVLMNRDDMRDLGLGDGDTVDLESESGRMHAVAAKEFGLPRGNLLAYFPEANVLTATRVDAASRTPAFKSIPVRVEPNGRGHRTAPGDERAAAL